MIPQRIRVQGFLSYRDETELSFDGEGLWMLAGPNGAGKSALFDAITFALFGKHRLSDNHKGLINQHADGLVVEYEFALGADCYCVKRTHSRRGKSTFQVFHIKGPHRPAPNRPEGERVPVPETDTQVGLDAWVRQAIGLSYDTFTASVLLRQGKSDALLEAKPLKRHEILSQIVDLKRYERLHETAEERQKLWHLQASHAQQQLASVEPVDETRLAALPELVLDAQSAVTTANQQVAHIAGLKVHAEHWNKLEVERVALASKLATSQEMGEQAERIERDAARLSDLTLAVPRLRELASERARLNEVEHASQELGDQAVTYEMQWQAATQTLEEERCIQRDFQAQKTTLDEQRDQAHETLNQLAPAMRDIQAMARQQQLIAGLDQGLEQYAPDLDEDIGRLEAEVSDLSETEMALPWLQQYAQVRAKWRKARKQEAEAVDALAQIGQALPNEGVARGITTAASYADEAQKEVTRLSTLLNEDTRRLQELDRLDGKPTCPCCGQPLTASHLADERQRIRQAIRATQATLDVAQHAQADARELEKCEKTQQQALNLAHQAIQDAAHHGATAMQALSEVYRACVAPTASATTEECFEHDYPTPTDLAALRARADQRIACQHQLTMIQEQVKRRDLLRAQRDSAVTQYQELAERYPETTLTATTEQYQSASDHITLAKQGLEGLTQSLKDAETQVATAERIRKEIESALSATRTQQQQQVARSEVIRRVVAEKHAAIPHEWQEFCDDLTDERFTAWDTECATLTGADARLRQLEESRRQEASWRERTQDITRAQAEIPEDAHRPVAMMETDERATLEHRVEAIEQLKQVENELHTLEVRRNQRATLTASHKQATRQAYLYKELARFLGRDYLQRYLLQQAERSIVAHANRVLDRISAGTLRLELRRDEAGEEANERGAAKALDLVAYNSETQSSALPVDALSGSQRFRVSVSLALGIGYWASQGAQRIETVIIDEGFGSLDQQGRRDMIDQLHNLKTVLHRIIVVSHQEEFFSAFSQGYRIALVGGVSQVSDLEIAGGSEAGGDE